MIKLWNPESTFISAPPLVFALGRGVSQATHFEASVLFTIIQVSHSHVLEAALNCVPNDEKLLLKAGWAGAVALALVRTVSQATHFEASALLTIIQVSHSQVFAAALNWVPNEFSVEVGAILGGTAEGAVPGFGVSQATHFTFIESFFSIQLSHSH